MRDIKSIACICLAGALCACSGKVEKSAPETVRVDAIAVSSTDISASRAYSGTIEESSGTTLSFAVPGTVQRIYVNAGDKVAKGQLIAQLDDTSLRNAYEISLAALAQAQDAYNRMKKLYDSNSLPEMQWVEVQNTLRSAQSAAAIAKRNLDDTSLRSPIAGYVSEKFADAGSTVAPTLPIIKVVDIHPVKARISVPESEIANMAMGQDATVTLGSMPGSQFVGKITDKGVSANPISRSYDVKITLDNSDDALLPGMICDVRLLNETAEHAIVLPNSAVLLDANNQNFVWLAVDGVARKRTVSIDGMVDSGIVIASGLEDGDSVIVNGQQKVSENSKVAIINK
ncbi:MAG: efflux RND transporter periplasmic adaptor subunit [Muribaculaceae bacterium]|nr:efflux RND transporter periplasmic adaptor subunit [Muribaculaceae bacterium]